MPAYLAHSSLAAKVIKCIKTEFNAAVLLSSGFQQYRSQLTSVNDELHRVLGLYWPHMRLLS